MSEEAYREMIIEWMIKHDISTGTSAEHIEDLLEVIGAYIDKLKGERQSE